MNAMENFVMTNQYLLMQDFGILGKYHSTMVLGECAINLANIIGGILSH
jgi:hypothetical protein